jgi:hypothetical protein
MRIHKHEDADARPPSSRKPMVRFVFGFAALVGIALFLCCAEGRDRTGDTWFFSTCVDGNAESFRIFSSSTQFVRPRLIV